MNENYDSAQPKRVNLIILRADLNIILLTIAWQGTNRTVVACKYRQEFKVKMLKLSGDYNSYNNLVNASSVSLGNVETWEYGRKAKSGRLVACCISTYEESALKSGCSDSVRETFCIWTWGDKHLVFRKIVINKM